LSGAVLTQERDGLSLAKPKNDPEAAQKGDQQLLAYTQQWDDSGIMPPTVTEKGDFQEKGDAVTHQKGDFSSNGPPLLPQKGDFHVGVVPLAINGNENSNNLKQKQQSDPVIVTDSAAQTKSSLYTSAEAKKVGLELASFLEGHEQNVGGFIEKCKTRTPIIIRAAVIDTLIHAYFPGADPRYSKRKQQNRAACFHAASNRYTEPDVVFPTYILHWLESKLSWYEIEDALKEASHRYSIYMLPGDERAVYVRQWLCGEVSQQQLDLMLQADSVPKKGLDAKSSLLTPITAAETQQEVGDEKQASRIGARDWLYEDEAEVLAARILREATAANCEVTEAHVKSEQNVVVVEITVHGHLVTFKNATAWQRYFTSVQETLQIKEQLKRNQTPKGTMNS
jgi:hypothetical protein